MLRNSCTDPYLFIRNKRNRKIFTARPVLCGNSVSQVRVDDVDRYVELERVGEEDGERHHHLDHHRQPEHAGCVRLTGLWPGQQGSIRVQWMTDSWSEGRLRVMLPVTASP